MWFGFIRQQVCLFWCQIQLLLREEEWRGVELELAAHLCGILLRSYRLDWLRNSNVAIGDTSVIIDNRGNFAVDVIDLHVVVHHLGRGGDRERASSRTIKRVYVTATFGIGHQLV